MNELRITRNKILSATDWTQAVDSPLTSIEKSDWAVYRQDLRDLFNLSELDVSWPQPPVPFEYYDSMTKVPPNNLGVLEFPGE